MGKMIAAILIPFFCSCNTTNPREGAQSRLFDLLSKNDVALGTPQEGEWRYTHNEQAQSLAQYERSSPTRPGNGKNIIYLSPYGSFSPAAQSIISNTAAYLSIFYQVPVKILPATSDSVVPAPARRMRSDGKEQLLAPYFIDHLLKNILPANAIVLIAVTEKDLYPKDDWNFVFGLASYHERVGVCSINRLYGKSTDSAAGTRCLTRLLNITSHEIGHMFGLHHCVENRCVMNGSNSLAETDLQPNRLCSKCLEKLWWNLGFDNNKRLMNLQNYFRLHGKQRDYLWAKEDYNAVRYITMP